MDKVMRVSLDFYQFLGLRNYAPVEEVKAGFLEKLNKLNFVVAILTEDKEKYDTGLRKALSLRASACRINEKIKSPLVVAEVGVHQGRNALMMLKSMNIKSLFLIDPYIPFQDTFIIRRSKELAEYKLDAQKALIRYEDKVNFVYQESEYAAQIFPDNHFNFVYIDANHSYEEVKKDLRFWFPKVKKGGILGGHDYISNVSSPHSVLKEAVDEFVKEKGLFLVVSKDTDWYVEL